MRKKFFFESLQKQVTDLQRENVVLKDIIKGEMGDVAGTILDKCNTALPSIVTDNRAKATEVLERSDFNLMRSLQAAQRSFCITDPSLPDNPIVFASQQFLECTGYSMEQVLGRNCRFLQGPETDRRKVEMIRKGISEGSDTSVCLLNYRADGTTFWNQFFVAALRDVNKYDELVYAFLNLFWLRVDHDSPSHLLSLRAPFPCAPGGWSITSVCSALSTNRRPMISNTLLIWPRSKSSL